MVVVGDERRGEERTWAAREARAWRISRWALLAVLIGIASVAIAQRTPARSSLAELRDAFLVRHTDEPAQLYAPPSSLRRAGFREDAAPTRVAWLKRISTIPGWGDVLREARLANGAVERGRVLARALTATDSGGPSLCGDVGDLEMLLRFIGRGGVACCSDYTAAFLSMAPLLDIIAREVRVAIPHGVVEVYDDRANRWVLIDPLFGMMARDSDGAPLSVWGLQRALAEDAVVDYEFFGPHLEGARPDRDRTVFDSIYGPRFPASELSTPMGNNVLTYDGFRRPLSFLPKSIVQAAALWMGVFPDVLALAPDGRRKAGTRAALLRSAVVLVSVLLVSGLLSGPLTSLLRRLSVKRFGRSIADPAAGMAERA